MIRIERNDLPQISRVLRDLARTSPKALADAMNWTAYNAREALQGAMATSFQSPTRWTLGGIMVEPAKLDRMSASVGLRDRIDIRKSRGIPASAYLRPQILGGPRAAKSHEKALARAGVIPPGYFLVPTRHADLDAHGNMSVGQVNKILSSMRAFNESGFTANAAWGRKSRGARRHESYFAIVPGRPQGRGTEPGSGGGLPPGIYKAEARGLGRLVLPVAALVPRAPVYAPRFDFDGIVSAVFERDFPRLLDKAMARSIEQAIAARGRA